MRVLKTAILYLLSIYFLVLSMATEADTLFALNVDKMYTDIAPLYGSCESNAQLDM